MRFVLDVRHCDKRRLEPPGALSPRIPMYALCAVASGRRSAPCLVPRCRFYRAVLVEGVDNAVGGRMDRRPDRSGGAAPGARRCAATLAAD